MEFDINVTTISEPAYEFGRPAELMFRDGGDGHNDLWFDNGWTIRANQRDWFMVAERDEVAADALTPTNSLFTIGTGWEEAYFTRGKTELSISGSSANQADPGHVRIRKSVPSSISFNDARLSADQTSYPFTTVDDNPYNVDETVSIDRVGISTFNDTTEGGLLVSMFVCGGAHDGPKTLGRLYFNGPAGENDYFRGSGEYCLVFTSIGKAVLYERQFSAGNGLYGLRARFEGIPTLGSGPGHVIYCLITKSKDCKRPKDGPNGFVNFRFLNVAIEHPPHNIPDWLEFQFHYAVRALANRDGGEFSYRVPSKGISQPTNVRPIRMDFRRDCMGSYIIHKISYPTTLVEADDGVFKLPFVPQESGTYFEFAYESCVPTGCTGDATLHRADTDAELNLLEHDTTNKYKRYSVPVGITQYYVRVRVQATSTQRPAFFGWRIKKKQVTKFVGESLWYPGDASHPKAGILNWTMKGPERDLGQESCRVLIVDPLNKCTKLKTRTASFFRLGTTYDAAGTDYCYLTGGLAKVAFHERKPPGPERAGFSQYPVKGWGTFDVHCKGIWTLLSENFVGTPFTHLTDIRTGLEYKVTDLLKEIISRGGFDTATNFDFPDLDTRVFASNLDFSQYIDMLEKIGDVAQTMVRDYLEYFLIHDFNCTPTSGKWRLKRIPSASQKYTNVAYFTMNGPTITGSQRKLVAYLPSYGTKNIAGDASTNAVTVPIIPIFTCQTHVKEPEANWLMVSTFGVFNESEAAKLYTATLFNEKSFNMGSVNTADPNHPDFLGRMKPLYVIDTALGAAENEEVLKNATNALARRIADVTFHAVKMMTILAPLVLIDHEDEVGKKRGLRYYDPVQVDDTQWLIRNVNPLPKKDGLQLAIYELEAPRI